MADPASDAGAIRDNLAYFLRIMSYVRLYGFLGPVVALSGDHSVWVMQAEVLGSRKDETAMSFRKTVQDENTSCAVAAAIVSQIAITALSLPFLSQAHWVARGSWTLSLISGIMAVYYASAQHRRMGRLLLPSQVREWISKTKDLEPDAVTSTGKPTQAEIFQSFVPRPDSVLIVSAPQSLLTYSLGSFLIGLGVYLSFVWRRQLDASAGFNASRIVFIIYMVSTVQCVFHYVLSCITAKGNVYRENPYSTVIENAKRWWPQFIEEEETDQQDLEGRGGFSPVVTHTSLSRTSADDAVQQNIQHPSATELPNASIPHRPGSTTSSQDHEELPRGSPQHQALINALRESTRLRRKSAKVEELIARCYEQLLENH